MVLSDFLCLHLTCVIWIKEFAGNATCIHDLDEFAHASNYPNLIRFTGFLKVLIEIADDGTVSFATLIEEGKEKVTKRRGAAPVKERRVENQLKDPDKNIDIKLKICKGC